MPVFLESSRFDGHAGPPGAFEGAVQAGDAGACAAK